MPDSRFQTPEEAPAERGADSGETPTLIARALQLAPPQRTTWRQGRQMAP